MRPIDDILADVIEALEPLEAPPNDMKREEEESPLGLHYIETKNSECAYSWVNEWVPWLGVDTGALIDAARESRKVPAVAIWVHGSHTVCEFSGGVGHRHRTRKSTREAVIIALANVLGVETEE